MIETIDPADRPTPSDRLATIVWHHRGFSVVRTNPIPPIPGWQAFAFTWTHDSYDGPEDDRIGVGPSVLSCFNDIDEWIEENDYDE
jgi:hypothetical protein